MPPPQRNNRLAKAFTLAEVLITLGIIGIISALTIPNLITQYQKKTYITRLKKVCSTIEQASLMYMTKREVNNLNDAGLNNRTAGEQFIEENFKIAQKCKSQQPCFQATNKYRKLSGDPLTGWASKTHYVTSDGTSIGIGCGFSGKVSCEIYVDINGRKGPNTVGKDLFPLFLYQNGRIDDWDFTQNSFPPLSKEIREKDYKDSCQSRSGFNWHGCFGKILNDGWEMTYF